MSRLFGAMTWLRRRAGPLADRLAYEVIYSLPQVARLGLFNGGYHPPPEDMPEVRGGAGGAARVALYDVAMRVLPGVRPAPRVVLDIGCGPGGGLLYAAAAFPGARLIGVDLSRRAISAARRTLAQAGVPAELHVARGDRLPVADATVDAVVSISTVMYVGYAPFVAEAARVTAPGGVISVAGAVVDTPLSWMRGRYAALAREHGLVVHAFEDITARGFAAMEAGAAANEALIARLPWFVRGYAREAAVLPGSAKFELYRSGRKREYLVVMVREG